MLTLQDLPVGSFPKALDFIHFPTRHQAVIFRNWNTVPFERIAKVLQCSADDVIKAGCDMGLVPDDRFTGKWDQRGFITTIRRNWHLLNYGQLLELLDWDAEKLAFALKEEDFLYAKLGKLKPDCEPVKFRPLTDAEKEKTAELRRSIQSCNAGQEAEPWRFLDQKTSKYVIPVKSDSFGIKLVHSYAALYGDALLNPELDPYPENMLADYQAAGINAVWLQGTLYTLIPWLGTDAYSAGAEKRCEALRALVDKAAKYGIKLYVYLNEPRNMPADFFEKYHPDWKGEPDSGSDNFALCTSVPEVLESLKKGVCELFRKVPGLGGALTITMSENLTHCHSKKPGQCACPRCKDKPVWTFPVSVIEAIASGVHEAAPEADVIAWTWGWQPQTIEEAIQALPDNVIVMSVSETGVPTNACGVQGQIADYSIAHPGPGDFAKKVWSTARKRGLSTMAKVQLNCTWEGSFTPYIPVPSLVEQHLQNLKNENIDHLMPAWTLGGFPGGNFPLTGISAEELAGIRFGKDAAAAIKAQQFFADGFKEFPLNGCLILYTAPQNYGPAALFYPQKTNYPASMIGFPYDDMDSWTGRGHFSPEIMINQYTLLTERWQKGLDILFAVENANDEIKDLTRIAEACFCHYQSTLDHYKFVYHRDRKEFSKLPDIIRSERKISQRLFELQQADDRIGFESSNHYLYYRNELLEKVANCDALLKYFAEQKF